MAEGFPAAPLATTVAQEPFTTGPHILPSFDPIELLPERAQDLLRKLRQRSADAYALTVPHEEIRTASAERTTAENVARRLQAHAQDGGFHLPDDDRRVIAAKQTLARAAGEFERIKQRSEARSQAWREASAALASCEEWLRSGRPGGTTLEAVAVVEPRLNKGESLLDAVQRHRRRVRELKADLHRIESSCYPSSYCKQRMREQVEQLAARGTPSVSRLVEFDGPVDFQTVRMQAQVIGGTERSLAFNEQPDVVALVAFLHKSALIAALDALVDEEADDPAALSSTDRERRAAEVQGDLLAVERDEAWCVWRAIDERLPVEHRPTCDPRAILQIRLVVTAPRASDGPSSPGHAWDRR